jgi:hypothetical protein
VTHNPQSFAHGRTCSRQAVLSATALAAALLLSGCGTGGSTSTSKTSVESAPSSVTSTSPSPDPTGQAEQAVLTAYQGFWNLQVQAYTQGSLVGLPINTYAIGKADAGIRESLQYYVSQNLVMRGRPVLSPKVTGINLATKPYTATITDCVDTKNFLPVDKSTGKPAPLTDNVFRHPWTLSASFDNVQWRITDGSVDRSRTC